MKYIFRLLIITFLFTLTFCKKANEIVEKPIIEEFDISEVNFSFNSNYIYSKSEILINTDKRCKLTGVKVFVGESEAKILGNSEDGIRIVTPSYLADSVILKIKNTDHETVIGNKLKVYKGGLKYEFLYNAPYEARTVDFTFLAFGKGYIYGGSKYLGYMPDSAQYIYYQHFRDFWEIDFSNGSWTSKNLGTTFFITDTTAKGKFLGSDAKIIVNNVPYIFNSETIDLNDSIASNLSVEKYNYSSGTWQKVINKDFILIGNINFVYQDSNKISFGIVPFNNRSVTEVWCLNLEKNSFSFSYSLENSLNSDYNGITYLFHSGPMIYFIAGSKVDIGIDFVTIHNEHGLFYQYNTELKKQTTISINDISTTLACGFDLNDYGIMGEGIKMGDNRFLYSTRFFKIIPE